MNNTSNNYINNNDSVDEINSRILERNIPSANLDILFKPRPQPTRYIKNLTIDTKKCMVPITNDTYDIQTVFNPGTTNGPWSGFTSKINDESILKNLVFTLQNNPQSKYIPSTNSDLYKLPEINQTSNIQQPFPNLFKQYKYNNSETDNFERNNENIDSFVFNNFTRQQLKDS
jgi:hypothetical protein